MSVDLLKYVSSSSEAYIKCPVCFDIGGLGILGRYRIKKTGTIIYTCWQCSSSWEQGVPVRLENHEAESTILHRHGVPAGKVGDGIEDYIDDADFIVKGKDLLPHLYHIKNTSELIHIDDPEYPRRYLIISKDPVGTNGERIVEILLNIGKQHIIHALVVKPGE